MRDTRDLIRGRISLGAYGFPNCADESCPVQACDRPLCQHPQFLIDLHLDGPTRVGEFVSLRKTQTPCQIEVMVGFPVDCMVLGGRRARICPVFLSYILLGVPLATVVSKELRMVPSRATAVWDWGKPNPDMVYTPS